MAGGTLTPIILAASKIVVPTGTSIDISSIVTFGKAIFNLTVKCYGFGAAKLSYKNRYKNFGHISFCHSSQLQPCFSLQLLVRPKKIGLTVGFPLQSGA